MMTIVTHVELKPGTEGDWDRTMHERLRAAEEREGWVAGQLLRPVDKPQDRVIVGTWLSREHWEAWHRERGWTAWRRARPGSRGTRWWRGTASPPDAPVA
jgi:heme-degrading monooxygenase HmoA